MRRSAAKANRSKVEVRDEQTVDLSQTLGGGIFSDAVVVHDVQSLSCGSFCVAWICRRQGVVAWPFVNGGVTPERLAQCFRGSWPAGQQGTSCAYLLRNMPRRRAGLHQSRCECQRPAKPKLCREKRSVFGHLRMTVP